MSKVPLVLLLACSTCFAQSYTSTSKPATESQASPQQPKKALPGFGLEDGTSIRLKLTRNLSSADARTGDQVDFETLDDISVDNLLVIPKGSIAKATVTDAEHKKRMGRGGKLDVNIDSVRLKDGERVNLRAIKAGNGGGHVGAMTGAMVATGIVFFPAAPLFLFMHGKDITIPQGTEVVAYIDGDALLDRAKFVDAPEANPAIVSGSQTTVVNITSVPPGADIEVDGNFSGNSPSTLNLPLGEHSIKITKNGFQPWERKIKLSGGSINLNAELQVASP